MTEIIENANDEDQRFLYMFLDRMRMDCKYFLGNGNKCINHLAGGINHINLMKETYNKIKIKPEWLTMKDIESYQKQMKLN